MKNYLTPDFDVPIFEIEDVITLSIGGSENDYENGNDWWE